VIPLDKIARDWSGLASRDVVIISSIDWSHNWQIHQQLATSLVECGHRVLFVENTGVRAPRAGDFGRIRDRLRNWFRSTRGFHDVRESLTVFSPLILPFPYIRLVLLINRILMSSAIGKWMRVNRFHDPVLISFLPTPLTQRVIEDIDPLAVIYYCADDMSGRSAGASRLRRYEDEFLSRADAVFCTSHALLGRAAVFNARAFLFPAGVDFQKFEASRELAELPVDLASLPRPLIGYVGSISSVFDQSLLVQAARGFPKASFVLVGPYSADVSALRACPNIHLLGKRPHAEVPAYIKAFDVALIPYVRNVFTDAVYSCKLNEYLAMGTAVVAIDTHELRLYAERYVGVLALADSPERFVEAIGLCLEHPDEAAYKRRIETARANSWEQRFAGISEKIEEILINKQSKNIIWQDRLVSAYRRGRIRIYKRVTLVATIYALFFYSPLMWWAGDQLVVRQIDKPQDAIVVFSGDGEVGYVNNSYQNRTLDALRLYQAGYADQIVLSSGKGRAISEVEVIRSILLNKGVPASAILIVDRVPSNTKENVLFTANVLKSLGISRVLFVTAPYHSRRATMVWNRLAPEIELVVAQYSDEPSVGPVWGSNLKTVQIIAFEYFAIVYYWIRGWV